MKKLFTLAIFAVVVWLSVLFVRPYWDRHWLQVDMEEAALYGTKRSEEAIRKFLDQRMQERGRTINGADFVIDKDERNTVHVKLSYSDEVEIAGRILKRLRFNLEAREMETKNSL